VKDSAEVARCGENEENADCSDRPFDGVHPPRQRSTRVRPTRLDETHLIAHDVDSAAITVAERGRRQNVVQSDTRGAGERCEDLMTTSPARGRRAMIADYLESQEVDRQEADG